MKSLIKIVLLSLLIVFVLAPFTFLPPQMPSDDLEVEKVVKKTIKQTKKIVKKVEEKPLHNVILPDFSDIKDVRAKKKAFFDFIKPTVIEQNNQILAKRAKLNTWLEKISLDQPLTEQEYQELDAIAKQYRVKKDYSILTKLNQLLLRVDIIPMPLVLVQAANESAWGTSRFSRIGLNFFGIWCYRPGCGMVPDGRDTGARHEVAAFQSVEAAVARYFYNINTNNAYRVFRTIRFELRAQDHTLNPEILATGLLAYSERGADYVIDITTMLRQNKKYLLKPTTTEQSGVVLGD